MTPDPANAEPEPASPPGRLAPVTAERPRQRPRRLPVVPAPLPEESLFSWIDHLAAYYEVDRTMMMRVLGLEPKTAHAARLAQCTVSLTTAEAETLSTATGMFPAALSWLTTHGITGEGRDPRPAMELQIEREVWAFCPHCLKPPVRWPLWWYESWAVLCPVHHCYLVSFCPDCDSAFTPPTLRGDQPGRCPGFLDDETGQRKEPGRRRRKRKRCNRPLWDIPTQPVADPVVTGVLALLRQTPRPGGPPNPTTPRQWYDDFRTLRALLADPNSVRVRDFPSPDPALQERFTPEGAQGDTWTPSRAGFSFPMRTFAWGGYSVRDPITTACILSAVGLVLQSDDMTSAARGLWDVPHPMRLTDFSGSDTPPAFLLRASPALDTILHDALGDEEFTALQQRRAQQVTNAQAESVENRLS